MKFLVIGSGGRECAIVNSLCRNHDVYCLSNKENPLISDKVIKSFTYKSSGWIKSFS